MKKVTIITFQNAYNYGAVLQCFALQETLSKYVQNVEVLNYDNRLISDPYKPFINPKENIFLKTKAILSSLIYCNKIAKRNKNFEKLIKSRINLTQLLSKGEILEKDFDENNILIAGSDQIWNTKLTNGVDDVYFLNFGNKAKKISYAASIGREDIDEEFKNQITEILNKYNYISVREETAKNALERISNKKIDVVLDPTLLLTKCEWEKYISSERIIKEKYIFVYMPDKNVINLAKKISKMENLKICNVAKKRKYGKYEINKFSADPFEFIRLIRDAEYVITSSFHGTALSIVYNKKFWVFPPENLSTRITDLLNKLNILNRAIMNKFTINQLNYKEEIDYQNVNKIVFEEKEKSLYKIQNNIS